jgi:hypothetical protein
MIFLAADKKGLSKGPPYSYQYNWLLYAPLGRDYERPPIISFFTPPPQQLYDELYMGLRPLGSREVIQSSCCRLKMSCSGLYGSDISDVATSN